MAQVEAKQSVAEAEPERPPLSQTATYENKAMEKEISAKDYELKSPLSANSDASEKQQIPPLYVLNDELEHYNAPAETARDFVTEVLHAVDDPTLNPWTFRVWFLGIGLSTFGGTLATIYYFKPQVVGVSTIFLAVISYVLGELMSHLIPSKGLIGKLFNPYPFNKKEHAAIVVMAASAANAPLAVEVLAVNKLWYNKTPHPIIAILLTFSSQCLGYGVAGLLRKTLVYPTKMLFPALLPVNSLLEVLHGEKSQVTKRLRVFYIGFGVLFFWEFFPQYIMPVLTGISVFCLAKQDSLVFTNLFGGSNGNEGLGLLSLCLDWQYIGGACMWLPLQTLTNNLVGNCLCIICFMAVYYSNIWRSMDFPFLSQLLFTQESNSTHYVRFNQTQILDANLAVDDSLLGAQGLPYFTGSFITYILSTNLAITATFTHMLIWNYDDIKSAWSFANIANMKRLANPQSWNLRFWRPSESSEKADYEEDPHYKLMLAYKDAPNWWFGLVLVMSIVFGLISIFYAHSTLPWWGFLVAISLSSVCILFFAAQYAITGFAFGVQPVIQMLGGELFWAVTLGLSSHNTRLPLPRKARCEHVLCSIWLQLGNARPASAQRPQVCTIRPFGSSMYFYHANGRHTNWEHLLVRHHGIHHNQPERNFAGG